MSPPTSGSKSPATRRESPGSRSRLGRPRWVAGIVDPELHLAAGAEAGVELAVGERPDDADAGVEAAREPATTMRPKRSIATAPALSGSPNRRRRCRSGLAVAGEAGVEAAVGSRRTTA